MNSAERLRASELSLRDKRNFLVQVHDVTSPLYSWAPVLSKKNDATRRRFMSQ
jgi:hypothetical protein